MNYYAVLLNSQGEAIDNRIIKSEATLEALRNEFVNADEVAMVEILDVDNGYSTALVWTA